MASLSKPLGGKFTTEFRLGGASKLRMRATSDSGVGNSSHTPSRLVLWPTLYGCGGGDRQRFGSGEVGREADLPKSSAPYGEADSGDLVSERR